MSAQSPTKIAVHASISALTTIDLANVLLKEYDELIHRFDLADYRPSELNGARFAEGAFRVCQQVCTGNYTPIGKSLPRVDKLMQALEQTPVGSADDTFRIHIPRALRLTYDLRNKRDVAHLGGGVSPNYVDASLVVSCANWVTAEIVRVSHQCDVTVAQNIVNDLAQRRTSLIWSEDDIIRVLKPELPYKDQVLLILHHLQPDWTLDKKLFEWVEYSNLTSFKKNVLKRLHDEALIHYRDGEARILPPGNLYIENERG